MDPHEKPDAWQAAHQLALEVYAATERWPRAERFELTTQVRRAALSVPTNIAEAWHVWGRASCGVSSMCPGVRWPSSPICYNSLEIAVCSNHKSGRSCTA
jgi:hypothetical protein